MLALVVFRAFAVLSRIIGTSRYISILRRRVDLHTQGHQGQAGQLTADRG